MYFGPKHVFYTMEDIEHFLYNRQVIIFKQKFRHFNIETIYNCSTISQIKELIDYLYEKEAPASRSWFATDHSHFCDGQVFYFSRDAFYKAEKSGSYTDKIEYLSHFYHPLITIRKRFEGEYLSDDNFFKLKQQELL